MPKVKSAGLEGVTTVAIYIFLTAALGTYFLPVISVNLPVFGMKSLSVRDVVQVLPKGIKGGEKREPMTSRYDFMDMVKEVSAKKGATKSKIGISPTFIAGALVPVALALAYLLSLLGLFLAPLRKGRALVLDSILAALCASYVYFGIFVLNNAAQRAFQESLAKVAESPFSVIAKNLVQKVTIQPEKGVVALILFTLIVFGLSSYRSKKQI